MNLSRQVEEVYISSDCSFNSQILKQQNENTDNPL